MSTSGHSLYRPIKVSDILSLGFEIHESVESDRFCIKISKDKVQDQIEYNEWFWEKMGFNETEVYDYYYLYLDARVNKNSHDCVWSFTRYNVNSPALDYFLEGLHLKGYKLKVEGERYDYEKELWRKSISKKSNENNLVVSE
jgi:hypothetical protein